MRQAPVRLILDTDMGNDIDDALALAMIHSLQARNECKLLGVSVSKHNPYAAVYTDILNTFYDRGHIPIGAVADGVTPDDGPYARYVSELRSNGQLRYARTGTLGGCPEAVGMLRRVLAGQPDGSVVPVLIGFSTNMARLLESPPDEIAPLAGRELFRRKVRRVVMMAADFSEAVQAHPALETREYNILNDIPAARAFIAGCPRPIVFSGLEIGAALMYPGEATAHLYHWAEHHPVADAYERFRPVPYDRPSWDLTAVLAAVRPDGGDFGLSDPGWAIVDGDGIVRFRHDPDGPHRHLTLVNGRAERTIRTMVELVTQPAPVSGVWIKDRARAAEGLGRGPRAQRVGGARP